MKKNNKITPTSNKQMGNDILEYLSLKVVAKDAERTAKYNLGSKVSACMGITTRTILFNITAKLVMGVIRNTNEHVTLILLAMCILAATLYVSMLHDDAKVIFSKNIVAIKMDELKNKIGLRNIKSAKLCSIWVELSSIAGIKGELNTAIMGKKRSYIECSNVKSYEVYGVYIFMINDKLIAFSDHNIFIYKSTINKKLKLIATFDVDNSVVNRADAVNEELGRCIMIDVENKKGQKFVISNQYLTITS